MDGLLRRLAVLLVAVGTGCGGGGGNAVPIPIVSATPVPTATPVATAPVSVAVAIPNAVGTASLRRNPRAVSPATAFVSIVANGGTPTVLPAGSGTPCATSPPFTTCRVYATTAPVGNDTFTVTLLDASSHILASGSVPATVTAPFVTTLNVTFDSVVASLRVALANASPPAGTVAAFPVFLVPLDPAGFAVIGAPGALLPITVTDGDGSGATGVYLAGSDFTCATQAAPPASSVTTTASAGYGTGQYVPVCLRYNGATISSATITASAGGGISATTTLTPQQTQGTPAGFWLLGAQPSGQFALERVDAAMQPTVVIAGSQTNFGDTVHFAPSVLAVDASGNVSTIVTSDGTSYAIVAYSGTTAGNVPPSSSTQIVLPNAAEHVERADLAVDSVGNAYVIGDSSTTCTVYRVALASGPSTGVAMASCFGLSPNHTSFPGLFFRAGRLYLADFWTVGGLGGPNGVTVFRFVLNGAAATPDSAITWNFSGVFYAASLALDPAGNPLVAAGGGSASGYRLPGGSFVVGQNTAVIPIQQFGSGSDAVVGVDPTNAVAIEEEGRVVEFAGWPVTSPPPEIAETAFRAHAIAGVTR